jgi:hypothetical protein
VTHGKPRRLPNSFELKVIPPDARGWDGEVRVLIGGRDLVDLVRAIELPAITRAARTDIAGSYAGLTPAEWADAQPNDDGRVTVLGCDCGVAECWPLRVRVRRLGGTVEWSDFEGPLASGGYEALGPFLFNVEQYDREVAAILARAAE